MPAARLWVNAHPVPVVLALTAVAVVIAVELLLAASLHI